MTSRAERKTLRCLVPPVLLLVLSAGATAETSPYYFGGALGSTAVSNPYRAANGTDFPSSSPKNDSYTTLSLLAGIDQPIGRERLFGTARLSDNRWQHNSSLNGRSYDISGGVDWEASNRWTGTVKAGFNEDLALAPVDRSGTGASAITIYERNVGTSETADGIVRYGVNNRLSAVAGAGYRSIGYSSPVYRYLDYSQKNVSLSVNYTEGGALTLGVGPRFTRGVYPTASCRLDAAGAPQSGICTGDTADNYTRRDLDLTAKWIASGASTVDARISYGKERHTELQRDRDVTGLNGNVDWDWWLTGKLLVKSTLQRGTGQDLYFSNLTTDNSSNKSIDYSDITTAARVEAKYNVTAKIGVNTALRLARRPITYTRNNLQGLPVTDSGVDNTTTLTLGTTWAVTRSAQFGCDVSVENRRSSNTAVSAPYRSDSIGCNGQLVLR